MSPRSWALVVALLVVLLAIAVVAITTADQGKRPPFLQEHEPITHGPSRPPVPSGGLLRLAGSGSNLPVTRALADAFASTHPHQRVLVHESIGSTGGIRAAYDRVIDVALVSRPLKEDEQGLGLVVVPYARVPVVVAANASVVDDNLSLEDLLSLYAGEATHWSDGTPIVVLQRERGDSSHMAVTRSVPEFERVNDRAYREGRWRVLYSDSAMQEAIAGTEGSVGLTDLGAIESLRLPVKVLRVNGVSPEAATVRSRAYPFVKELAFVTARVPSPASAELIAFARSARGRAIVRDGGYIPPDELEGLP